MTCYFLSVIRSQCQCAQYSRKQKGKSSHKTLTLDIKDKKKQEVFKDNSSLSPVQFYSQKAKKIKIKTQV